MGCLRACCGGLREGKLFGMDLDDLFALGADKTVKIRDKKLGLLKYFFMFLIAIYIFIYEIGLNNKYLKYYTILPSLRLTFQQPTLDGCNPNSNSCFDNLKGASSLPYCKVSTGGCTFMDGFSAALISGAQILVPTVVQSLTQNKNLTSVSGGLTKLWISEEAVPTVSYMGGIVDYTIGFDHSISIPSFPPIGLTLLTYQMSGKLFVEGKGALQQKLCNERSSAVTKPVDGVSTNTAPCYIDPDFVISGIDIFTVSTILAAVNSDIDVDNYGSASETFRAKGFTITMEVHYYNVWPGRMGAIGGGNYEKVNYVYTLSVLRAPFKTRSITWLSYPVKRTFFTLHGMLLTVATSSTIGAPEFQALLLTLTSSLALLAVSGVLVNLVAVYFLRFRPYYCAMLTEISPDFSEVNDLERKSTDELRQIFREERKKADLQRTSLVLKILTLRQEARAAAIEAEKAKGPKVAPDPNENLDNGDLVGEFQEVQ